MRDYWMEKKAVKAYADLGDDIRWEYDTKDSAEAMKRVKRIKELSKPMSYWDSFVDSLPYAAGAAAAGGALGATTKDVKATLLSALASGGSTALINTLMNAGKRKMSVFEAIHKSSLNRDKR